MDDGFGEVDGVRNRAERREVLRLKIEVANLSVRITKMNSDLILLRNLIRRDPPALEVALRTIDELLAK